MDAASARAAILDELGRLRGLPGKPYVRHTDHWELASVEHHLAHAVGRLAGRLRLAGQTTLDYGCGGGASSVALALQGARVVAADPDADYLGIARLRLRQFGLEGRVAVRHLAEPPRLPWPDATFDLVTAISVFEYVPEGRREHLREIWRVLRPGGVFFLGATPNGLYPREPHSGAWLRNYAYRACARRQPTALLERGVTYWEVRRHLPEARQMPGAGLEVILQRVAERCLGRPAGLGSRLAGAAARRATRLGRRLGWPPGEAFLPWLDLCFEKPAGPSGRLPR